MQKGISLHIGLNQFDPTHYGYPGRLRNCEADAAAMLALAQVQRFTTAHLFGPAAARAAVLGWLHEAARRTKGGDLVLLTFAGRGCRIPHESGRRDAWCLHDAMLLDDELQECLSRFAAGVRIVVLADASHGGRAAADEQPTRTLPPQIVEEILKVHREFYAGLLRRDLRDTSARIKASAIFINGCADDEEAADGDEHGAFTAALLKVWDRGARPDASRCSYRTLVEDAARRMAPFQAPCLRTRGATDVFFEDEAPLVISDSRYCSIR